MLFRSKRAYDYSRTANPTRDLLGIALADLEAGAGAVITSSGMAAISLAGHLFKVGARIVAPHDCYGGSHRLFCEWQRRGEFEVQFVDYGDEAALCAALSQPAALVWIETPSNPLLVLPTSARSPRWPTGLEPSPWSTIPSCRRPGSSRSSWAPTSS